MKSPSSRQLELLAPAGNADVAIQAIKHGADAVYIGPPSHGARKSASNSIDDIRRVSEFAHLFNARVYVTVNTIIFEHELRDVEKMIRKLYLAGADALIVQDMSVLRMDIPPIALHASTQCDIRTPEKARFLQEAGFSQIVLARELSLTEIKEICRAVTIPVETFVHGALCVSYSGRCGAGYACSGRSGNRGECPQICRQCFTLKDAANNVLAKDRYLLSLKDFNASRLLPQLVDAGVSSFKIEGRLKESGYVKNLTSFYHRQLDEIIASSGGSLSRSSSGRVETSFVSDPYKSFNRGFTTYFLEGKRTKPGISSMDTPKSMGEKIKDIRELKPGDGISFFDSQGNYTGALVNGVKNGKIIFNRPVVMPRNADLRRTSSVEWNKLMAADTSRRRLALDITFDRNKIAACDETGAFIAIPHGLKGEPAIKTTDYRRVFEKLGGTNFYLRDFYNEAAGEFFPLSALSELKRLLVDKLLSAKKAVYKYDYRRKENEDFPYVVHALDYRDNVANSLARDFYRSHGVEKIEDALELHPKNEAKGKTVMTTRHCILRELGLCLKNSPKLKLPLLLESGNLKLRPHFDCKNCEMHLLKI